MWKVLRHNGKMDTLAANKLMRWVCETSEDIKDFIAGESALAMLAETDGVVEDGQDMIAPDAESYGNLVQQLLLEGDYDAAREVAEVEMPAAGFAAGTLPRAAQRLLDAAGSSTDTALSRMRTSMLCAWADECTDQATSQALSFFDELKRNQSTDVYTYNVMLSRFCQTSDDVKKMIYEDMAREGIEVDASMIHILVRKLANEGKFDEAQHFLNDQNEPKSGQWRQLVLDKQKLRVDLI